MRVDDPSDGQELRICPKCGYESHTKVICPHKKGNCMDFIYLKSKTAV